MWLFGSGVPALLARGKHPGWSSLAKHGIGFGRVCGFCVKMQCRGCSNCNEWRTAGEAKGKFSDRDRIPFSFDMSTLNKIVSDSKSIQKSFKEFGQSERQD